MRSKKCPAGSSGHQNIPGQQTKTTHLYAADAEKKQSGAIFRHYKFGLRISGELWILAVLLIAAYGNGRTPDGKSVQIKTNHAVDQIGSALGFEGRTLLTFACKGRVKATASATASGLVGVVELEVRPNENYLMSVPQPDARQEHSVE